MKLLDNELLHSIQKTESKDTTRLFKKAQVYIVFWEFAFFVCK